MVGLNQGVLEFANYSLQVFGNSVPLEMYDDIQGAVKLPLAQEVMVGWVVKINFNQVVFQKEMVEDGCSGDILGVHISITSDVNMGIIIGVSYVLQAGVQTGESSDELILLA